MSCEHRWHDLRHLCRRLHLLYGQGVVIPSDPDPFGPLVVFDDVKVEDNPMRLVPYTMWLEQQPHSFEWFEELDRTRGYLLARCTIDLKTCLVRSKRRREPSC